MSFGIYELKKLVRAPVIRSRRKAAQSQQQAARVFLEQYNYTTAAQAVMGAKAIDPHLFHRADLDENSVVVDVGAFRGDGAAQIHDLYGARVYAFEPNMRAYTALEKRFAKTPEVVTLPYGLGPADATMTMDVAGPASSVYGRVEETIGTAEVEIRDVSKVLDELGLDRIDFMKVNIEGAEYDLLDRLIKSGGLDRVRYLLVQFHEWHASAHRRRWSLRRRLHRTHEEVWNYPWIWELWCSKSEPHPPPPPVDEAMLKAIIEDMRSRKAAAGEAAGGSHAGSE